MIAAAIVMTVAALVAALFDLRTRRIPNALTAALALFALVAHTVNGVPDLVLTLVTMLVMFAVGTFAFSAGWFGGGDVKLVAGCAGVVGAAHLLLFLALVGIWGGVVALLVAAAQGRVRALLQGSALVLAGHPPAARVHLPYGVAIAAGALTYTLLLFTVLH